VSPIKVNIGGRVWSILGRWNPEYHPDFDPQSVPKVNGMVTLGKNQDEEKYGYIGVGQVCRGGFTEFFYAVPEGGLYYSGEDPSEPSDRMVVDHPYDSAEQISLGRMFLAKPEFDIEPFVKAWFGDYGEMHWHDEGDEDDEVEESTARQLIDSASEEMVADLKRRKSIHYWTKRDPDFKRRVDNPRQAIAGDVIEITTRMKRGTESRLALLTKDAEEATRPAGKNFPIRHGTSFSYVPPGFGSYEWRLSTGSGWDFWNHEPQQWGIQDVKVVGHIAQHPYRPPNLYGNPGYDLMH